MNAVLDELRAKQAAEQAAEAAESPAQYRARRFQEEFGLKPSRQPSALEPTELAKVLVSQATTPVAKENVTSFFMMDERGAGQAPTQAARKEAGTHDVAAALDQPGRAATSTQEVLTTPHVRRSVYGRESHGAVSEGLLQAQGDDAFAREQPFGLVPHEVPTFSDVRSSAGAGEGLLHDERLPQEQGQGLSSLLVDITPPRTGLSDPLRPEKVPLTAGGRGPQVVPTVGDVATFVAPSLKRQKNKTSREGYDGSFETQDPHSLRRGPTSPTGRTVQTDRQID